MSSRQLPGVLMRPTPPSAVRGRTTQIRSWRKRRTIATRVVDELSCYVEVAPRVGKDGFFDLTPEQCDGDQECSLGAQLKAQPKLLEALRDAIPKDSERKEDQKRRQALKQLIKHPNKSVDRDICRDLGDMPTSSENRELNEPRLENPTSMQISVTVRLAERNRSLARSTRRRVR